ncbi:exported hypothetical protein [Actinacidiphila cocklensis]|uniref:PASTA domain-containing protein n=1 Tax=Actinacidiphila cocklensis TaxID=887465 RepID=A0A9W4GV67_9ACTN|nr:exported hypothetical protein [Actinacidiphila cocklensis]
MHIRIATIASAALLATGLGLAGCNPNTTSSTGTTAPSAQAAAASASASATTVPSLVGLGLQTAQDTAQAAGFSNLTSHDASGDGRMQILDRNWKVCDQTPSAGDRADDDVKIDLGAVKLGEPCPNDAPPTTAAAPSPTPTTHAPVVHHTAPGNGSTSSGKSGSSGTSTSGGTATHHTESPVAPGDGATAQCNDGTLSYSQHHQGTCSHHGGVAVWYR